MRTALKVMLGLVLVALTLLFNVYHAGVAPKPAVEENPRGHAEWFDKQEYGLNHVFVSGTPFARGVKFGELTAHLLEAQEDALTDQLKTWLPYRWMWQVMVVAAITWYHDIDRYLDPEHLAEMYGVSKAAPKKYEFLADGYTRQVAYHGLHEVGQMVVDQGFEGMGCTVVAVPKGDTWIVGRNFDFEGGRIFDSEKIVKWVYPDRGHAFMSVIWAGMVGAVTGVNDKGLYVSINAGGSADFARVGMPSTLVLAKVLQEAASVDEALKVLRESPMFITDIFVVLDRAGRLVRVEKSPKRVAVLDLRGPSVVANHLLAPEFANDAVNLQRQRELTTLARQKRGQELAREIPPGLDARQLTGDVLKVLRDKGVNAAGEPLPLGHRQAIDALIATHATIYDAVRGVFYISQGPALAGAFLGYDIKKSFATRTPVKIAELARDERVSDETFSTVKENARKISLAQSLARRKRCADAVNLLENIASEWREHAGYYLALGDAQACGFQKELARASWEKALKLGPAYAREERDLRKRLKL